MLVIHRNVSITNTEKNVCKFKDTVLMLECLVWK